MSEYTELANKHFGRCGSCGTDWIASDSNVDAFAEAIRRKTLEEAKQICIAVKVSDESESTNEGDEAYNLAISHCCGELSIAQEGVTK